MSELDVNRLTQVYLKIKNERSKNKAEFESIDKELVAKQETIKSAMLGYLKDQDIESVKTTSGTFYRSVKSKYWTSDWESMHKFILENQVPEFFSKSLNQTNVKQFLEENPDLFPAGLNIDSEYVLSVRKT